MRIVLDTNVLVSALLAPESIPSRVLALMLAGEIKLLVDERILAEYRDVLARPRFKFESAMVEALLQQIERDADHVAAAPFTSAVPDREDLPFVEVALSGQADAIVTGNLRHFPASLGVTVLSPRALVERLDAELTAPS